MISPDEAKKLILQNTEVLASEILDLSAAHGRYLSQSVLSLYDHPFFDQSAMDGYAFRWQDLEKFETLLVIDEIPAGKTELPVLKPGEAFRIYTGAAVPDSTDTVVIQENTQRRDNLLSVLKQPNKGANIRKQGELIQKRDVALKSGHKLNAASIGFLASIGISKVSVSKIPRISIVATGNEFLSAGEELVPGKIFESNGIMLRAALKEEGITSSKITCEDNAQSLSNLLIAEAKSNDILLITGGVSVGDYDFTPEALVLAGFEIIFHKINQKPGKPLLFAKRNDGVLAFGLPGNPQSVLSCYYQYVIPAIRIKQGAENTALQNCKLPLAQDVKNASGKTLYAPAKISGDGVEPLTGKGSHALQSYAMANAVIELPPEPQELKAGTNVLVHILPS
jgi:molybdopterin molybdotransferase